MKMEKSNLRTILTCLILLAGILLPGLQAQGWRHWYAYGTIGPFSADGNKIFSMSTLEDGTTISVASFPWTGMEYTIATSSATNILYTGQIAFSSEENHFFCRDILALTMDSIVVLEDVYPIAGGQRNAMLTKYKYMASPPPFINYSYIFSWTKPLLVGNGVNSFAHAIIKAGPDFAALLSQEHAQNPALRDVVLQKIDANGEVLWTKIYETPGDDFGKELIQAGDGGFFILKTSVPASNPATFETILMKTDALGNIEWESNLTSGDSNEPFDMTATTDGNVAICGINHSIGHYVFLVKVSPTGEIIWRKDLVMPDREFTKPSILEDANGDLVTAVSFTSTTVQNSNILLIKTAPNGDPIWERNTGKPDKSETVNDLSFTSDGGYVMGGYRMVNNSPYALFIKTDVNGIVKPGLIQGNVFDDLSFDCNLDADEIPLQNWVVRAINLNNNALTFYADTDAQGNYRIECDTGAYSITAFSISPYWQFCSNDVFETINYLDTAQIDFPAQLAIECPFMTVDHTTSQTRPCDTTTFYVHYCNQGTMIGENATVEMVLDPFFTFLDSDIPATVNGDSINFALGDVGIGICNDFSFRAILSCDAPQFSVVCSQAHIYPDSICLSPPEDWSGAIIVASSFCDGDTVRFILENIGDQPTAAPLQYIVIEDAVLLLQDNYELDNGQTLNIPVSATGATYRLIAQQEPGAPGYSLPMAAVEGCTGGSGNPPSYGFFNQFSNDDPNLSDSYSCWVVTTSFDPNDKQALPTGFGEAHNIFENTDLEYRIRFQNTGSDTAFRVVLLDTLSPFLNPATVRPGASSHDYDFEMEDNGVLRFTFNNIGLPHKAVDEDGSQGFVTFRVSQKTNNPIGTVIENSAAIYFDFNLPVITNTTWHTVHAPWIDIVNGSVETFLEKMAVKVSPNPMGDWALFELENATPGEKMLVLTDQMGREVLRQSFSGDQVYLQRDGLAPGMYFFKVGNNSGKLATGKIIVQ